MNASREDHITPTTEMVKAWYSEVDEGMAYYQEYRTIPEREEAFDRWFAEEVRKAKAEHRKEIIDLFERTLRLFEANGHNKDQVAGFEFALTNLNAYDHAEAS